MIFVRRFVGAAGAQVGRQSNITRNGQAFADHSPRYSPWATLHRI